MYCRTIWEFEEYVIMVVWCFLVKKDCNINSKCKHDLPQTVVYMNSQEWENSFLGYYSKSRTFSNDAFKAAISKLTSDNQERDKILEISKKDLDSAGKGNLGEAHTSYYLENKKNIILTQAGWKTNPFTTQQGTDLVGVCLDEFIIIFVEVKTRPIDSHKSLTLGNLRKQLSVDSKEKRFVRNVGESSYQVVTYLLKKHLREKKSFSTENLPDLREDIFFRLGTVVVGTKEYWNPIVEACPCDYSDKRPCELILYVIEDLNEKLVKLTAFEMVATRTDGDLNNDV